MKDIEEQERIIKRVIDCAYAVRTQLQQGYEEKIYRNAMCLEMQKRGVEFKIEVPYNVYYDDQVVGQYRIDLLIEDSIIVELKANQNISPANEVQLVNYLTGLRLDYGLLINFGAEKLQIKRKFRTYKPSIQ